LPVLPYVYTTVLYYHNFNLKKTCSVFNFFYYNIAERDYGTEEECACQV
jgi:hypothetical protein